MLWFLLILVCLQLAVGVWAARRIRDEDDYLVAGRRLGPALAAVSIFATWFGAESCIGAAGHVYRFGIGPSTTEPFAYGVCLLLMGSLFAAHLWRRRVTTLADFVRQRFGGLAERTAALLLLPSSLLWAAAQIRAFGQVVAVNSDGWFTPASGTTLAAAVAIAYTVSGGLLADVYTDVVQGALLLIGLLVLTGAALQAEVHTPVAALAQTVSAEPVGVMDVFEAWAVPICGSIVAQEALSRCLAARSPQIARRAAWFGGSAYVLVGMLPLWLGVVGARLLPGLADPEAVLPELSHRLLPALLNMLFAGALVSAILSTVDSCLLVVASTVSHNLWPGSPGGQAALRRARLVVVLAGIGAWLLANTGLDVKHLVEEASGFASAGVFVLALAGVHSRFGGALAANATLIAGLLAWLLGRHVAPEFVRWPYLTSLAAAATTYAVVGQWERRRTINCDTP